MKYLVCKLEISTCGYRCRLSGYLWLTFVAFLFRELVVWRMYVTKDCFPIYFERFCGQWYIHGCVCDLLLHDLIFTRKITRIGIVCKKVPYNWVFSTYVTMLARQY